MNNDGAKQRICCSPANSDSKSNTTNERITNLAKSSQDPSSGMVAFLGATFLMGTEAADGFPGDGEGPVRPITLDAFSIGTYPVTNEDFYQFVQATHHRTQAECFGSSFVFWSLISKLRFQTVVGDTVAGAPWWCQVPGACWNHPEGPGSDIVGRATHPVVHVSWNDAQAFCCWSGTALPTEAQWEYAARGGLEQRQYPWGDTLCPDGQHRCNIWQGEFPVYDSGEDGYAGTSPVDAYPPNGFGLFSATGNTWEWCSDWFDTEFHRQGPRLNPQGPDSGASRVMKGGSFLCHKSYCNRYRVGARSSNTADSSSSNVGFRCVLPSL